MSTVQEREAFRKRVELFIVNNDNPKKSVIVNHFQKEGTPRSTMYKVLDKLETDQPIRERKRTGRPTSFTPRRKLKLKRLINNRTGVSQRKLARKFGVDQATISRQLSKMKVIYRKRVKTPKYSDVQRLKAKKLSRKLVNELYQSKSTIIMDDEKYFCWGGDNMPGNAGYYTSNKDTCPESVRFKGQDKYPKKVLLWIALSERGFSKPLFRKSKSVAVNSEVYIEECLTKRLLPFIHKYHPDFDYIFWPDLASAHYAKDTVTWMEQNVYFVHKSSNPPNVPQARPIENFWGCLAQKVYEGGWEAETEQQLIHRIELKLREFDQTFLQNIMKGVKNKLRSIADKGVFSCNI